MDESTEKLQLSNDDRLFAQEEGLLKSLETITVVSSFLFGLFTGVMFNFLLNSEPYNNPLINTIYDWIYWANFCFMIGFFFAMIPCVVVNVRGKRNFLSKEEKKEMRKSNDIPQQLKARKQRYIRSLKFINIIVNTSYFLILAGSVMVLFVIFDVVSPFAIKIV